MSTKRPLQMFQQRSPKRRKAVHLQEHASTSTHQKYPASNPETYNPQQSLPPSNFQQSYPPENTNFTSLQNDRTVYHPQGQAGPNYGQHGPRIYQQPANNLGYNPGQNMSIQSYTTGYSKYNNVVNADQKPQYSEQSSNNDMIGSNQNFSYQDNSKSDVSGVQYGSNSYHGNLNLVNQNTVNNRSFEDKSALYTLNQSAPHQPYNSSIRYYNPQQNAQFPQQNAQFPQQNAQFPQQNAQFPQQNAQFPQQNAQLPQQNAQLPQQNAQFSVPNSYHQPAYMVRTQAEYPPDARGPGARYPSPTATSHAPTVQHHSLQNKLEYNENPVSRGSSYPTTQYKLQSTPNIRPSLTQNGDKRSESKNHVERKKKVSDSNRPHLGRKRIITCNISAMLHWAKLHHNTEFMFELFACLNSVECRSDISYKLQLKDSENNVIDANYFLSSSTQPDLVPAKYYRVIGKVINASFHCFKLKEVPYMETRNAASLIKQSEIAMSKLILLINEN